MQATYIILTLLIFVFHILYKGDLSFILLVFLLALPAILFILLMIQTAKLKIFISCSTGSAERGKPEIIRISLENRTVLPITACRITFRYTYFFPADKPVTEKYSVAVPISQLSKEAVSVRLVPEHCGHIDISAKNVMIYDMIGLTFIFRKINFRSRITVFPSPSPFSTDAEKDLSHSTESDIFSRTAAGDDPSEIFGLREYRSGDGMNRIHWKLSSRGEDLIVKEFSAPMSSRVLMICDTGSCGSAAETDKIFDLMYTVSSYMTKYQAAHTISAARADGTLFISEISDVGSSLAAFTELCGIAAERNKRVTDEEYIPAAAELIRKGFSNVLAFSADGDKVFADELSRLCGSVKLTVFCTSGNIPDSSGNDKKFPMAEIIYSDAENLDEAIRSLHTDKGPYSG